MKAKLMAAAKADRNAARPDPCRLLAAVALLWLALAAANAAAPGGLPAAGKNAAVTLEPISGSSVKRVTLSARAAERLGIETGKVSEQSLIRRQMVGGLITLPVGRQPAPTPGSGTFGGFAQAGAGALPVSPVGLQKFAAVLPAQQTVSALVAGAPGGAARADAAASPPTTNVPIVGEAWVQVSLSPGELERLTKEQPARLLALSTRDKFASELLAQPSGMAPVEDAKRSMLTLYYVVPGKDHGLMLNSRVRVELQYSGNEEKQKVVPYSAVYYDGKGAAWVYVNTQALTYERQRIEVERVAGDLAVLSGGPPIGTPIVTVGAPLLFGAEIFGK
ncbi:MAG: hypothetical protein ABJA84_04215 [Polaromonas sp.]